MVRVEHRENGAKRCIPIANFTARVVSDITVDDGAGERRQIEIEAEVFGKTIRVILDAAEFSRMNWVLRELGSRAIIYPGQQQHARAAIQSLSGEIRQECIFAHLGWAKHQNNWVYLQPGEVLGARGPVSDLRVHIADPLKHYHVRQPTAPELLRAALRSSLAFLSIAPDRITIPLLASVYRAPLGPADFSLFLAGLTGTFKTALAALCQQHFGSAMNPAHLPANFASTSSAIEEIAFQAKDVLVVIDDFVPGGQSMDGVQNLAERIFRAAGNRQGRSRMRGNGLRSPRPPRAFLVATGEEVPLGHSIRARLLIIDVRPGCVDRSALTRSQQHADQGRFASAMGGYLAWIAARYEDIQQRLRIRMEELRRHSSAQSTHARLPGMIAELMSGWEIFLEFATESGAINSVTRNELVRRARCAFDQVAAMQACHHQTSDPALRFLTFLEAALATGVAHIANRSGDPPENSERWGWRSESGAYVPQGHRIGWISGTDLFLNPAVSHRAAQQMAGSAGLSVSAQTIRHRLHERGLLLSVDSGRGMLLIRRVLENQLRQVLHLRAELKMSELSGYEHRASRGEAPT